MDQDCPICHESLGYAAFEPVPTDVQVSETVFRLKCGHGFHMGCLCHSLRLETACPLCRTSAVEADEEWIPDEEASADDDEDDEPADMHRLAELTAGLLQATRKPQIQAARSKLHRQLNRYRTFERQLQQDRANCIKKALREFRETRYPQFRTQYILMHRSLKRLRKLEQEATSEVLGEDVSEEFRQWFLSGYRVQNWAASGFGPFETRFWGQVMPLTNSN